MVHRSRCLTKTWSSGRASCSWKSLAGQKKAVSKRRSFLANRGENRQRGDDLLVRMSVREIESAGRKWGARLGVIIRKALPWKLFHERAAVYLKLLPIKAVKASHKASEWKKHQRRGKYRDIQTSLCLMKTRIQNVRAVTQGTGGGRGGKSFNR